MKTFAVAREIGVKQFRWWEDNNSSQSAVLLKCLSQDGLKKPGLAPPVLFASLIFLRIALVVIASLDTGHSSTFLLRNS